MSFLKEVNKDSEVVLLSDLPKDLLVHGFDSKENRRNEYKQIMADVNLDSTTFSYGNFYY